MSNQLAVFAPKSHTDLEWVADKLSRTGMIPAQYKNKPDDCFAAIMMGAELGVSAMQSLQGIAVINGRPAVWGDLLLALCRAHPECESICEGIETDDKGALTAWCTIKRKGNPEQTRKFSQADALKAGLWTKAGPWTQYPSRMLQMRARAFCARDVMADALKGIASAEEVRDTPQERFIPEDQTPVTRGEVTATAEVVDVEPEGLPPCEAWETLYPQWADLVLSGKKSADKVCALVRGKFTLTPEQESELDDLAKAKTDGAP